MSTIKEDYVSFEIAKLLKEKGFDGECRDYYNTDGHFYSEDFKSNWNDNRVQIPLFSASTHQMVTKWLREVHNLFIEIQCYGCEADEKAHFEYSYVISEYVKFNTGICTTFGLEERNAKSRFPSYEDACEAAIKYCLENLII